MLRQPDDRELVLGLARAAVKDSAPAELEVFDLIADGYRESGIHFDQRGDGAMGYGADVITTAVAAIPVAHLFVTMLEASAEELGKEGMAAGLRRLLQRRRSGESDGEPAPLPPEFLTRARNAARQEAVRLGLKPDKAQLLANAVAGALATGPP